MSCGIAVAFNGHLHVQIDYSEIKYLYEQWGVPHIGDDPKLGCSVQIGKYCTMIRTFGREGKEVDYHYLIFSRDDGVTLKNAYEMYKDYCEQSNIQRMPMYKFREELKRKR